MKEFLIEANMQEFLSRYKTGKPFAIISAFQADLDKDQNKKNNVTLRKYIKKQGYDMIRLIGHYAESNDYYESMIVFAEPEQEKELVRFLLFFGRKYFQNSFFLVDSESNIWQYSSRQDSTIGGVGRKIKYDKFIFSEFNNLVDMYTKRTYVLDNIRIIND